MYLADTLHDDRSPSRPTAMPQSAASHAHTRHARALHGRLTPSMTRWTTPGLLGPDVGGWSNAPCARQPPLAAGGCRRAGPRFCTAIRGRLNYRKPFGPRLAVIGSGKPSDCMFETRWSNRPTWSSTIGFQLAYHSARTAQKPCRHACLNRDLQFEETKPLFFAAFLWARDIEPPLGVHELGRVQVRALARLCSKLEFAQPKPAGRLVSRRV